MSKLSQNITTYENGSETPLLTNHEVNYISVIILKTNLLGRDHNMDNQC